MPLPPANYDALLKELAELLVIMVHHCMEAMGNAEANQMKKTCWELLFWKTKHTKSYKTLKMNVYFRWTMPMFRSNLLRVLILFQNAGFDFVSDFCFVVVVVFFLVFLSSFWGFCSVF